MQLAAGIQSTGDHGLGDFIFSHVQLIAEILISILHLLQLKLLMELLTPTEIFVTVAKPIDFILAEHNHNF